MKSEDEFLKKMKYQVFPIIREYIADGILRPNLANQISELNNYWKTGEIGNEKTIIDDLNKKYSEWTNSKGVQQE